jgi:hypothetical protein
VDFLSFSLGTPFLQSDLQLFTRSDVFQTQKANVLFVLDASDDDIPFNSFQKITINQKYYPQDSVATLTTLITGYSPSDHGIVAKHWASPNGGIQKAYYAGALPEIQNFVDVLSRLYEGIPLTISASSDFQFSSTLSASQELAANQPNANNYGFYWDGKCFASVHPNKKAPFKVCKSNITEILVHSDFPGLFVEEETGTFEFNNIKFKLSKKSDLLFLAEISFVAQMIQLLEEGTFQTLIKDSTPDMFSFTFASLKALKKSESGEKYQAALDLIEQVVKQTFESFSLFYDRRVTGEVIVLNMAETEEEDKMAVYSLVKNNVQSKELFSQFFPSLFLTDIFQFSDVCLRLKSEVNHLFDVHCPLADFTLRYDLLQNGTTPGTPDVATFQIVLWMSIILVLTTYAIIYSIYSMEVGGDSYIYRVTNLNNKKAM